MKKCTTATDGRQDKRYPRTERPTIPFACNLRYNFCFTINLSAEKVVAPYTCLTPPHETNKIAFLSPEKWFI